MNKRHLTSIAIVMILLMQLLAACDSGSPSPTPVSGGNKSVPTAQASGGESATDTPAPADTPPPTDTAESLVVPTSEGSRGGGDSNPSGAEAEWTVLIYSDADDPVLEGSMLVDLKEAEIAGSTDKVNIVAQVDRLDGTKSGLGNWTGTKRFYIKQEKDINKFGSQELANLGELNMADPQTLSDFITWGVQTYPAKKYAIILSDHGIGWVGCCSDHGSGGNELPEDAAGQLSSKNGGFGPDVLWLSSIDIALSQAQANTGVDKFEFVGFDECLMSQLEVYTTLMPYARYSVASEEVEPAIGWAYGEFLGKLNADPEMDGAGLGKAIVDAYIDKDVYISMGLADANTKDTTTLTAVDLEAMAAVGQDLDALVGPLSSSDQAIVAEARRYAQSYQSPFGTELPSSYVDLGNFLGMIEKRTESADVKAAIATLMSDYTKSIVAEKHGSKRPGSTGIAIYFPVEQEGRNSLPIYAKLAERFTGEHLWDEYLVAHYDNKPLGDAAAPPADEQPEGTTAEDGAPGPGKGDVVIDPIQLADTTVSAGSTVNIKTNVVGDKLAYLYFFVGHLDEARNLLVTDRMTFVPADQQDEEDGVQYPVWPDGGVAIDYDWQPQSFALTDGTNVVNATFDPEEYGDSPVYRVEGMYTSAEGQRYALLFFQEGDLIDAYAYSNDDDMGSLTQVTPKEGDTFTPIERAFDLDPNATEEEVSNPSDGILTYGKDGFSITETEVKAGEYVMGFVAEDLDGQQSEQYAEVTVQNP